MIGIIGAMSVEVDTLKGMMENKKTEVISGVEFVSGSLCGKEAVVAMCGIGKVFAAICTEAMIMRYHPDCIINTGVAGSLCDKLQILDVAVSSGVIQHDMDTSPLGDPRGYLSGIGKVELEASDMLCRTVLDSANGLGICCIAGRILSGDRFIATHEEKESLAKEFGGIACEMEGASVGHVCYVNKVPFAVIRAISDSFTGEGEMEYTEFVKQAAEQSSRLTLKIVENIKL